MSRKKSSQTQSTKARRKAAYDSPWKISVERLFPQFMLFFFPEIYALIDWSRPHKFLSQELEQISAGIEGELSVGQSRGRYARGKRAALRIDELVEVHFKDGSKGRILLHVEIQNEPEASFDERLFIYHYRIFDKFRDTVITLALLTDFDPDWRPGRFVRETAGCRVVFEFPARKLMDYNAEELAGNSNPFAFIAQAHINARATSHDLPLRYDLRMVLQDVVEESGMDKREVLLVTRFIEEVMRLPAELDRKLFFERQARKEGKKMEYTTYAERVGERRGIKKGKTKGKIEGQVESKQQSVLRLLEMRFGKVPKRLQSKVARLTDLAALDELFTAAFDCPSLKQFEARLPKAPQTTQRRQA